MDTKRTRDLVYLAILSLFCASVAWAINHAIFGSLFTALSAGAILSAAFPRPRR